MTKKLSTRTKKNESPVRIKKEVTESPASSNDLSGFGESFVKLTDKDTGQIVCYVGIHKGTEKVFFDRLVEPEQVEAVVELLQKKKFNKHIGKEQFDKAQEFANRKF